RDLTSPTGAGQLSRLFRSGTLTVSGASVLLSEQVGTEGLVIDHRRRMRAFGGGAWGTPFDQNSTGSWSILSADLQRYQNHALPGSVILQEQADKVTLSGLNAVAELGYRHQYTEVRHQPGASRADPIRPELLLIPRGDGSALQYGPDTAQPI